MQTEILYDYCDWELTTDGVCLHKGRPVAWYQDERTKKPWIPAKRKSWVSLVKAVERDGDITYLPNEGEPPTRENQSTTPKDNE